MSITTDEASPRAHEPALGLTPESLSLLHRIPRLPALAVRTEALPHLDDASVELRLLGAGHQVVLRLGGAEWIETLAQVPGHIPHLPTESHLDVPGAGAYEIRCTVTEHSERGLAKQRERFRCQSEGAQASLHLRGADGAAAAVCLHVAEGLDELQWRTWRTQPAQGRLVHTVSSLQLAAAAAHHLRAS